MLSDKGHVDSFVDGGLELSQRRSRGTLFGERSEAQVGNDMIQRLVVELLQNCDLGFGSLFLWKE